MERFTRTPCAFPATGETLEFLIVGIFFDPATFHFSGYGRRRSFVPSATFASAARWLGIGARICSKASLPTSTTLSAGSARGSTIHDASERPRGSFVKAAKGGRKRNALAWQETSQRSLPKWRRRLLRPTLLLTLELPPHPCPPLNDREDWVWLRTSTKQCVVPYSNCLPLDHYLPIFCPSLNHTIDCVCC